MTGISFKKDIEPLLTEDEKIAVQEYVTIHFPTKKSLVFHKDYGSYHDYFSARSPTYPPFNTLRPEFMRV